MGITNPVLKADLFFFTRSVHPLHSVIAAVILMLSTWVNGSCVVRHTRQQELKLYNFLF